VTPKSPVRENCTPGSVRGEPGNGLLYRDQDRRSLKRWIDFWPEVGHSVAT